jgi:spermidine/putrescine transport system permease protein
MKGMIGFYIVLFFLYLFGPLMVMSVTAFNTPNYPQAYPFEGFTLDWFVKLWNHRLMMEGLVNSIIIGLGVVAISVPVGLAASIIMNQIYHRARGLFYLVTDLAVADAGRHHRHLDGDLLEGRDGLTDCHQGHLLQGHHPRRSWPGELCLSLLPADHHGPPHALRPRAGRGGSRSRRLLSAGLLAHPAAVPEAGAALGRVIAFLSSFENYNTTTFAILADKTLVTVLAGEVRQGTTPALSALAVIIIGISLAGAIIYEVMKRREEAMAEKAKERAKMAERGEVGMAVGA